jgi:hypothetical protein
MKSAKTTRKWRWGCSHRFDRLPAPKPGKQIHEFIPPLFAAARGNPCLFAAPPVLILKQSGWHVKCVASNGPPKVHIR